MKDKFLKYTKILMVAFVAMFGFILKTYATNPVSYDLDLVPNGTLIIGDVFIPRGSAWNLQLFVDAGNNTTATPLNIYYKMGDVWYDRSTSPMVELPKSVLNTLNGTLKIATIYDESSATPFENVRNVYNYNNLGTNYSSAFKTAVDEIDAHKGSQVFGFNDLTQSQREATLKAKILADANIDGLDFDLVITDNVSSTITFTISNISLGFERTYTVHDNNVTAAQERIDSLNVVVKKLPNKLVYNVGETISLDGGEFYLAGYEDVILDNSRIKLGSTAYATEGVESVSLTYVIPATANVGEQTSSSAGTLTVNITNNQELAAAKQAKITELQNHIKNLNPDNYHTIPGSTDANTWELVQAKLKAAIQDVYGIEGSDSFVSLACVNDYTYTVTGATYNSVSLTGCAVSGNSTANYSDYLTAIATLKTKKNVDNEKVEGFTPSGTYADTTEAALAIIEAQSVENGGYNTLANTNISWNGAVATVTLNGSATKPIDFTHTIIAVNVANTIPVFDNMIAAPDFMINRTYNTTKEASYAIVCSYIDRLDWITDNGNVPYTAGGVTSQPVNISNACDNTNLTIDLPGWNYNVMSSPGGADTYPLFNVADHVKWNGKVATVIMPNGTTRTITFANIKEYDEEQNHIALENATKNVGNFLTKYYETQADALAAIRALVTPNLTIGTVPANAFGLITSATYTLTYTTSNFNKTGVYKFEFTNIDEVLKALQNSNENIDAKLLSNYDELAKNWAALKATKADAVTAIFANMTGAEKAKYDVSWNGMTASVKLLAENRTLTYSFTNITEVLNQTKLEEVNEIYRNAAKKGSAVLNDPTLGNQDGAMNKLASLVSSLYISDNSNPAYQTFVNNTLKGYYSDYTTGGTGSYVTNTVNLYIISLTLQKCNTGCTALESSDEVLFFEFTNLSTYKTQDDLIINFPVDNFYANETEIENAITGRLPGANYWHANPTNPYEWKVILNSGKVQTLLLTDVKEYKDNYAINQAIIAARNLATVKAAFDNTTHNDNKSAMLTHTSGSLLDKLDTILGTDLTNLPGYSAYKASVASKPKVEMDYDDGAKTITVTYELMYGQTVTITYVSSDS